MTEIQKKMDEKIIAILDVIEPENDDVTKHVKNVETLYKLRQEDMKNETMATAAKRAGTTNRINSITGAVIKAIGAGFKVWLGGTWYWSDCTGKIIGGPLSRLFGTWTQEEK